MYDLMYYLMYLSYEQGPKEVEGLNYVDQIAAGATHVVRCACIHVCVCVCLYGCCVCMYMCVCVCVCVFL